MESIYTPSDWGKLYHSLPYREALGAGAAGPGKSLVLLWEPLHQIMVEHDRATNKRHPHRISPGDSTGWALHLRRTMPELDETLARAHRWFPRVDPGVRWDANRHMFHFTSGYRYQFGHCQQSEDYTRYMSQQFTMLCFDELTTFEEEQYLQLDTRLRSSDPVLMHMLKNRSMSNPFMGRPKNGAHFTVKNPHWVRDYFVKPAPQGGTVLKKKITRSDGTVEYRDRIYLKATLFDNPDKDYVKQYEVTLLDKPAHIRQALLYGNWWVTVGSFHGDDWNESLHVCKPFHIPDDWKQFRSMDWGYKAPGCVYWWAMDPDGVLYCVSELTFQGKLDKEVAELIKQKEISKKLWFDGKSRIQGVADTQLWEQRGDSSSITKAEVFQKLGVPWLPADKLSRQHNAQLLSSRLRDHKNGTQPPGIIFFDTCTKAIESVPGIESNPLDLECPMDGGDDHWYDAILYACAHASRGSKGLQKPRETGKTLNDRLFGNRPKGSTPSRGAWGYWTN